MRSLLQNNAYMCARDIITEIKTRFAFRVFFGFPGCTHQVFDGANPVLQKSRHRKSCPYNPANSASSSVINITNNPVNENPPAPQQHRNGGIRATANHRAVPRGREHIVDVAHAASQRPVDTRID